MIEKFKTMFKKICSNLKIFLNFEKDLEKISH